MAADASRQNPYVGPRAFEEAEGARFFGRDRELSKLLNLLIARRLVLLHSPSGAGKTSLIQAALIPRLRAEGFVVHRPIRVNAELPPEIAAGGANRYLLSTLTALDEELPSTQRRTPVDLAQTSLTAYLDQRCGDSPADEVLIFDQFEELLTADTTDGAAKAAFLAELGHALEDPRRWALFAIREDYLGQLRPLLVTLPTRLDTLFRLDLLDPTQARRAIQAPARAAGGDFDDAAATRLIDDLRQSSVQRPDGTSETVLGQSVEPVQLQVVCYRLWARLFAEVRQTLRLERDLLLLSLLESVAPTRLRPITADDVAGVGDVDTALRHYYAEQVAATAASSGASERAIRDWVEGQLISEGGLRSQVLRRPGATAGLSNAAIEQLVDAHLLRAEERRGATWYELAHDRLVAPVRADNATWFEAHLSTLQRQARLWDRAGRPDGLLLRGDALAQAEQGLHELNEVEKAFLVECWVARQAEERERRERRRTRNLAVGASIAALFALIAAGTALVFYNRASDSAQSAVAQQITAEANAQRAVDQQATAEAALYRSESLNLAFAAQAELVRNPTGALLLATEAFTRTHTPFTDNTLRAALDQPILRPHITLSGDDYWVNSVAYSPDGTHVVTASYPNAVIWDATSGVRLTTLQGDSGPINSVAYSPDSRQIVTAAGSNAFIWDAASGAKLTTLVGHSNTIYSVAYSPDGTHIVTASGDGTAIIWDVTSGAKVTTLTGHRDIVLSAAYSPDGTHIVTASVDRTAIVWDTASGARLITLTGHRVDVRSAAYSPDGAHIVTASYDSTAIIWDATNGARFATLQGHSDRLNSATYSPDGRYIVSTSWDNTAVIWDATSGAKRDTLIGHSGAVMGAAYSPDGHHIITASGDQTAIIWEATSGAQRTTLIGHSAPVNSVAYSPDGTRIVTASNDRTAIIWDAASGTRLTTLIGHSAPVMSAAYSPDGTRIVTASADGTASIWDATNGARLAILAGHSDTVTGAVYSPDGHHIVTISYDGNMIFWDATSGVRLTTISAYYAAASDGGYGTVDNSLAYSPDGTQIVTASKNESMNIWNAASGAKLALLTDYSVAITSVAYSPDSTQIVTAAAALTAIIWDVASGARVTTLTGHSDAVTSAAYSPDGRRIVTTSADQTAIIWDAASGAQLATLTGHSARVTSAAYSPDGRRIVTASDDGTAMQYLVDYDDLLHVAACRLWRDFTPEEITRFNVPQPLKFSRDAYSCPPDFSREQPPK